LARLDEKQNKLELSKQKKRADLMLIEDEASDDDFFQHKISDSDY
jgi:hypothetical protein